MPCTRAALLSIHNFEILNGPVERSLRRYGTDPALSGAFGEIRVPAGEELKRNAGGKCRSLDASG